MALLRHGPRSNLSTMRCRIPFPYPVCHLTPQFHAESHRLRRQGVREERQLRHGVEQPPCNACRQGVRRGNGACLERRPHHGGGRRQWLHVHKPRRCLGLGEVHVQPVIDEVDHREVQHVDLATPRAQLGVTLCRRRWRYFWLQLFRRVNAVCNCSLCKRRPSCFCWLLRRPPV